MSNELKKDPVADAVQQRTRSLPNLETATRQLIGNSLLEYGELQFQIDGLNEQLAAKLKRREEIRQHVAALQASLEMAAKLPPAEKAPLN